MSMSSVNSAEVPKDKDPEVVSEQSSNKSADETGSQEKPLSAEEVHIYVYKSICCTILCQSSHSEMSI